MKIAEMLVRENMINFVGSDLHHARHFGPLQKGLHSSTYQKVTEQPLLNNSLL
jgi:tyrosine-protein phosphatase YwqE